MTIGPYSPYKHYNVRFVILYMDFFLGKNTKDNHLSILTFSNGCVPVTYFPRNTDVFAAFRLF